MDEYRSMLICSCGYQNFPDNQNCRRCGKEFLENTHPKPTPPRRRMVKKKEIECVVCLSQTATHILIHGTSAHQGFCEGCAETLYHNNEVCPLCREDIEEMVRLY